MKSTEKYRYTKSQYDGNPTLSAMMTIAGFLILSIPFSQALAQSAEEEALKATLQKATEAFFHCDADQWQSYRIQDEKATRTNIWNGYYRGIVGWENFGPEMIQYLKDSLTPAPFEFENNNYVILQDGNLAWVEYDQTLTMHKNTSITREHRAMVKQNGQWKIASQITTHTDSFGDSPQAIEGSLNNTGYLLLGKSKVKEAIEVFKLNVKLFPEAWNTYDSLGEAYAMAGDTDRAIKNYKKSIALNPDNENGKKALEKLENASGINNQ